MGLRTILLLLGLLLLLHLLRRAFDAFRQRPTQPSDDKQVQVLRCLQCGVHVPEQEAVIDQQGSFCCRQHQLDFQRDRHDN
jgi:hypothetical protein